MKKINFLLTLFIVSSLSSQQTAVAPENRIENVLKVAPPEYTNILRYDKIPDIGFAGGTDISVPIYEIDLGFKIPINLSYNTKGFKLSDVPANTGLGWNLTGNGIINLEVNDIDDFTKDFQVMQYDFSSFEPDPPNECLVRIGSLASGYVPYYPSGSVQDLKTDSAPDYYSINAPGLKTKFYLKKDISNCPSDACTYDKYKYHIKFLDFGAYKTEPVIREQFSFAPLSNPNIAYYETYLEIKKFVIYNDKGYKYTFSDFSGQFSSFTNVSLNSYWMPGNSPGSGDVNMWYLTSIETPENQKIEYIYEEYTNDYQYLYKNLVSAQQHDFGYNFDLPTYTEIAETEKGLHLGYSSGDFFYRTRHLGSKRLKKIIFPKGKIDFYYNNSRQDYPGHTLDKIVVKDLQEKIIKDYTLQYSYFLPKDTNCTDNYDCLRLRLDKITELGVGAHQFKYGENNGNNQLPRRSSSKIDFLGFYNNNSSNYFNGSTNQIPIGKYYFYPDAVGDKIFPFKINESYTEYVSGNTDRTSNNFSLKALMTGVIFPTGGISEIEYENDKFRYLNNDYLLGSSRIKSLTLKDVNSNVVKKINYEYTNDNGISSGQISDITLGTSYPVRYSTTNTHFVLGLEPSISYNLDSYVGYSRLTQSELGKGKIVKSYTNYNDFPNIRPILAPNIYYGSNSNFALTDNEKNALKIFKVPNKNIENNSDFRGRLLSEYFYKEGNNSPIKYSLYQYDNRASNLLNIDNYHLFKTNASMTTIFNTYVFRYLSTVRRKESLLSKKTEVNNFNGAEVSQIFDYEYLNNSNITKSITSTQSNGNVNVTKYLYSTDKNNVKLNDRNMVGIPLETEILKNGKTIGKTEIKYDNPANLLPTSILSFDNQSNTLSTEVTYDLYDNKGNLLQYTTKEGLPTTFIWGYNQTKPIAKIEGATYAQVMSALGLASGSQDYLSSQIYIKSNADIDQSTEEDLIAELDVFRKKSTLANYQISTYTYNPLIGVTTITPPSGIRSLYKYDPANRLESIVDLNGKIVKDYTYNYSPTKYYNTAKSQLFNKNCNGTGLGSLYNYTVQAGTYTSSVSQADADQQAQDDINANGQNLANSVGTCTPISCSLSFNYSLGISGGGSVSVTPNSYYKVSFGFSSGSNSMNLPWTTTGVKIATIGGTCKPITDYSSYNGQVYFTIKANGDIILKRHTGTSTPNNTSYNYELFFPLN
ncbi:hypothetical protein CHRY9390_01347 [Chryseobacterium aquaeductus]|uniref:DUF5977 domain-containing protein n=1 Tax=Chryseobacterium aquaeductus TaxID=2675056 RepID=A0A9N8MF73_9FLAO|nr:DUF5977 domain-containing protein [Chryseobacterium aquaeductus]CAA7330676.1 hypothetical protein CHRY9390_01347 [Chryseobacterium potabilaquae]CAD7805304.1 hypothetical protein CHRY9390_01347 [Chryseobacterium aquaeductus]